MCIIPVSYTHLLGSDNQIFKAITEGANSRGFKLLSTSHNLYLTPVGISTTEGAFIEVGLAPENSELSWQTWNYTQSELVPNSTTYALTLLGDVTQAGSRLGLFQSELRNEATFTLNYSVADPTLLTISNNVSGLYLTIVDNFTYKNPMLESNDIRKFNYPPSTNWDRYNEQIDFGRGDWTQTSGHITLWELMPGNTQTWQFIKQSDNVYRIYNTANGMYLGVREDKSTKEKKVIEFNANKVDEDPASLDWVITDVGGLASIINRDYNLALQCTTVRQKMTQTEIDYEYITDMELAFKDVYILTVNEWKDIPAQKWNILSEEDLQISIEAGENWFKNIEIKQAQ